MLLFLLSFVKTKGEFLSLCLQNIIWRNILGQKETIFRGAYNISI